MNRFTPIRVGLFALALGIGAAGSALALSIPTPTPNSAVVTTRIYNDCPTSDVQVANNYPSELVIQDSNIDCFGFANMHIWRFSEDGATEATFSNNSSYRFGADFKLDGTGHGEGGLQIAPWWPGAKNTDGLFNVRTTDGEIAVFGGRLPFFTFTGAFGLHYQKGQVIHLEMRYEPRTLHKDAAHPFPGQVTYSLDYQGQHYTSGPLDFDQANPAEDPPHGQWGELTEAHPGGHFKAFLANGNTVGLTASWSNITFETTPTPNAAIVTERLYNDCPTATLTTTNDYPNLITFDEQNIDCFGFANYDLWHLSDDGGLTKAPFNNNSNWRLELDFKIEGTGHGEGGIVIAPWWDNSAADGLFNVRSSDGEIACFGGRLPFYSFSSPTGHNIRYHRGDWIHLSVVYESNGRTAASPATITYGIGYLGQSYSSPAIPFDSANPAEDEWVGSYGMLNYGHVGGHFKAFLANGATVSTKASFANINLSECLHPAAVSLDIKPDVINLNSKSRWITAYITPESPLTPEDINVGSLALNGVPADRATIDGDRLVVKFPRAAVAATLEPGSDTPATLTGEAGGQCIESSDAIRVTNPSLNSPHAGASLTTGSVAKVQWDVDPNAHELSLLYSKNDGQTWAVVANNVPNTGAYDWLVPSSATGSARLLLTAIYSADESGPVSKVEYASSGTFAVTAPLGVGNSGPAFALRVPNPVSGNLTTTFSLPNTEAAELTVFDVAGRAVVKRDVGGQAGSQSLKLGALPTGVYVVRLSQAGRSLSNRIAVVQ